MLRTNVSGPSPDLHVYVFASFLILDVWGFLRMRGQKSENEISLNKVKYWIFLAAFIITVKLSALVVALIFLPALIYLKRDKFRFLVKPLILASIVLLVWGARTFIITGQVIYPFPPLYNSTASWTVTEESVIKDGIGVKGWARHPGIGYREAALSDMSDWMPEWWKQENKNVFFRIPKIHVEDFFISHSMFYIITLFLLACVLFVSLRKKRLDLILFFMILFLMVVFWLVTAPDIRFATFTFGLIFTLATIEIAQNYEKRYFLKLGVLIPSFLFTLNLGLLLPTQLPSYKLAIKNNLIKPKGMGYGVDWFTKDYGWHKKINLDKEKYYYLADTTYTMTRSCDTLFPSLPEILNVKFLGEDWVNGIAPVQNIKEPED